MASLAAATGVSLSITRKFPAPRDRVFEAWTQPTHLKIWSAPTDEYDVDAEVDLRVGGSYRMRMNHTSGETHTVFGEYVEVDAPNKLVYTWSWESGMAVDTLVSVEFRDLGEETEVTLTHERLPSEEICAKHNQGWNGCFNRLEGACGKT